MPRAREQAGPPAPPENRPPRRGVRSSSENVSAAGQLHGLRAAICSLPCLAAAAWLAAFGLAALVLAVPAQAQVDPPDTTAPSVTSALVDTTGGALELQFSEWMQGSFDSEMLASAFSVTCNGGTVKPYFINLSTSQGLFANLPRRCSQGQTVVISYDPSAAGADAITDQAGNPLAAFTTGSGGVPAVDNQSTVAQLQSSAMFGELKVRHGGPIAWWYELDLTPPFASDTTSYTTGMGAHVDRVRIRPDEYENWMTFEWLDANDMTIPDLDDRNGLLYAPEVGRNVIKAKLTSEDWSATRTYTVTLFRGGPQEAPTITGAVPGDAQVTLSWEAPASDSGITRYEYYYTWVDGERTGGVARWKPIPDSGVGGANQAGYTVTGLNNRWIYTFILRAVNPGGGSPSARSDPARPVSVADAALTGLSLGTAGTLLPSFALDRTTYTAEVAHSVEEVTVTPTASNPAATIDYLDASDAALADVDTADGQQVAVAVGDTVIKVKVTSPDGTMTQTYTVTVRRAASGMPWLSVADAEGSEADGVTFTVTLSDAVTEAVTATWTARSQGFDTVEDADLTSTTGTVTVTAGETTGTFTVTTENDATDEEDETFRVTLSDPSSNAAISDADVSGATAWGTILDDDDPPEISIADSAAAEGDEVTFTLTLSAPSEKFVTVDWATSVQAGDTATSGTDFTAAEGSAHVPSGDWTTKIDVTTLADTDDSEGEETFTVTLTDPRRATLGMNFTAKGTISMSLPARPTNFTVAPGNAQVELSWDAPASGSDVARHEYRHWTPPAARPETWTQIENSGAGEANEAGFTVTTGVTNETRYLFELRAVNDDDDAGGVAEAGPVTPTPGICDRTQEIQDAILGWFMRFPNLQDCAEVTVSHLTQVYELDLINKSITALKSGDFAGLTSLPGVDLSENPGLTTLPEDIFSGLTNIGVIRIDNNTEDRGEAQVNETKGLTSLPAGVFTGLTELRTLNLFDNNLGSLPADVFAGLTSLENLWLSSNALTSLPADVFDGLTSLERLHLGDNSLTSLPADVFAGLRSLEILELAINNGLTSLPEDVFDGLTSLTELALAGMSLDSLPAGVFDGLTSLIAIDLRSNNLSSTSLPNSLFDGLTGLTTLNLLHNPGLNDVLSLTVTVEKVGDRPGAGEGARGSAVHGGYSGDGGERETRRRRDGAQRAGGLGGGRAGHRDPHGRDGGAGDGGRRPEHPTLLAPGSPRQTG